MPSGPINMNTPVRQSALYNPDLEKYPYLLPSFEIVATRLNPCPGGGALLLELNNIKQQIRELVVHFLFSDIGLETAH